MPLIKRAQKAADSRARSKIIKKATPPIIPAINDTANPAAAPITAVLRLNTVPSDTRLSQKSRKVKTLF